MVLLVEINLQNSNNISSAYEIRNSLLKGGLIVINSEVIESIDPDFAGKYAAINYTGQYKIYPALLNFIGGQGWKFVQTAGRYEYFTKSQAFNFFDFDNEKAKILFIIVLSYLIIAILVAAIAASEKRSFWFFFFISLVTTPLITLIFLYGLKSLLRHIQLSWEETKRTAPSLTNEKNLDSASAYSNRGDAYTSKGEYDLAIADFSQAIKLNPNDAYAYNNRGFAYAKKGDYDRALADCDQALKLNPNYANAYAARGLAYKGKKQINQAIQDFEKALALDPNLQLAKDELRDLKR
jgi:tetratricopeptide (TPR) repeat protein